MLLLSVVTPERRRTAEHVGRTTGQTRSAAEHNPGAEFLRLSFQADYRQGGKTVNVTAQAGMQLVCDEPTRVRLIELNQKLLKGGDHPLPENREPNDTYDKMNPIYQDTGTSATTKATKATETNDTTTIL